MNEVEDNTKDKKEDIKEAELEKTKQRPATFTKLILIFESSLLVFSLFFLAVGLKVFLGIFLMGSFLFFLVLTVMILLKRDLRTTSWLPVVFIPCIMSLIIFIAVVNIPFGLSAEDQETKEVSEQSEVIKTYIVEFKKIKSEFIDKYELAGTTPRISLTPIISEMQDIRRELSDLDPPENINRLAGVKELCLYGMDKVIEGFQEFQMGNETKSMTLLKEADKIFESVDNTIKEIEDEFRITAAQEDNTKEVSKQSEEVEEPVEETEVIEEPVIEEVVKETEEEVVEPEEGTEEESKYLEAGMYKVGGDIPAGEYLIIAEGTMGYYQVAKDSSGDLDSIISNDNFSSTRYITVSDGQYLEIKRAKMILASEVEPQIPEDGVYTDGMYKAGKDIPAGEYKVVSTEGMAYFEVSKDSKGTLGSIVTNDNFEGEKYLTIKDGQYLKLNRCRIEIK